MSQSAVRYEESDVSIQGQMVKATQKRILRKYDEAIDIYKSILEKDMHNTTAMYDLSRIYLKLEDEENALEFASKSVKKKPENIYFLESLGTTQMYFHRYDEASATFTTLYQKSKSNPQHYKLALEAFEKSKNLGGALNVLEAMEENFGTSFYTSEKMIGTLILMEDYDRALRRSNKLAEENSEDIYFLELAAKVNLEYGTIEKANDFYQSILKIDPQNNNALIQISSSRGDRESLETIINSPEIDINTKVKALMPLINQLQDQDIEEKAKVVNLAQAIADLHPDEAKAYAILGDIQKTIGNYSAAISAYKKAVLLDAAVFEVWSELLFLLYQTDMFAELLETAMDVMDVYPNQYQPYAYSGLAHARMNNLEEATEMLDEVMIFENSNPDFEMLSKLLKSTIKVYVAGFELESINKDDLFMRGIKTDDERVLYQNLSGLYVVKSRKAQ